MGTRPNIDEDDVREFEEHLIQRLGSDTREVYKASFAANLLYLVDVNNLFIEELEEQGVDVDELLEESDVRHTKR